MKKKTPAYEFCREMARLKKAGKTVEYLQKWHGFVEDCRKAGKPVQWHHMQALIEQVNRLK